MTTYLGYLSKHLSFEKIAQSLSKQHNLNATLSKSMSDSDVQDLHNVGENKSIKAPRDIDVAHKVGQKQKSLSHLKDNRLFTNKHPRI